ncbi:SDR family oxidoreductase [Nocardioides immobilis]|uniref:SDR family oxidoreductase n=1 Tax=Nocardioides immobilis TaxID=2049295 RepID=A0A417Y781_9ACTN|nr:SDR family oxidoreductase [Nocardioides immobilis]RHW28336.1 SDR family oxidoreductase [Nocardioides immobilis]
MSRAALVTGASRGIGEAVACRLAEHGYDLTISARSLEALDTLAGELRSKHRVRVQTVVANMADETDVRQLAEAHRSAHGALDLLVLNAGMGSIGAFADYPVHRFDTLFAVNMRSAFVLTQELLPLLRQAGRRSRLGGRVIAVASTTGVVGEPLNSAYGATKAALISWCEAVSTEESGRGVSATAVCPGYVATAMTESLSEQVPPEEMIPVADVAEAVVSLARLSKGTVVPSLVLTRPGPHLWRA